VKNKNLILENDPLASLPNAYYLLQDAVEDPYSDFAQIAKIISITPRSLEIPSKFRLL
jgi:hypothetical protein